MLSESCAHAKNGRAYEFNGGDDRFWASPIKNAGFQLGGDLSPDISEGESVRPSSRMEPCGSGFGMQGVNPGHRGGETTEIKMVFDGQFIAALGVKHPDFMLEFFKSAFNFPPCRIVLNALFSTKAKVGSYQREDVALTVYENHFDLTFEGSGHADDLREKAFTIFPVYVNHCRPGASFQFGGKFFDRRKFFAVFSVSATLARFACRRHVVQGAVDSKTGQYVDTVRTGISYLVKQWFGAEPTIAHDQCRGIEHFNQLDDQTRSNPGFRFKPFFAGELLTVFDVLRKWLIRFLGKGQTHPASMTKSENAANHPAMSENPFCPVLLGGMIKMFGASGNAFSGFSVCSVVQGDQQASFGDGERRDNCRQKLPKRIPRYFGRIDEVVEFFSGNTDWDKKTGKPSEDTTDPTGITPGSKSGDKGYKNGSAIRGDDFTGLLEKFLEFHVRLLVLVKGYAGNIAHHKQFHGSVICCSVSGCDYIFDKQKGGLNAKSGVLLSSNPKNCIRRLSEAL